jgi:hypothetical protein
VSEEATTPSDPPAQPLPIAAVAEASPRTHTQHLPPAPVFTIKNILWVLFFLALTVVTRCANYHYVFAPGLHGERQIFYTDGDCYSRMTRVREVLDGWGVIHYHLWENYPVGIYSHTTAPMDYLIAGLALLLKPFMKDYVDMAGAIVSPLLGVMTTAFLALWARELNQQYRRLMLLLVVLSPILVHGTELGRPSHHSLQIFLLAVGIGAELIMARAPCVSWGIASGVAWSLALWVSLYEPLVMLIVVFLTKLVFYRKKLFVKERIPGFAIMLGILAIAALLEGKYLARSFYLIGHDPVYKTYLGNWLATIEEMKSLNGHGGHVYFTDYLYQWVGWGLLAAPLLLIARLRDTKRSTLLLTLMVATFFFAIKEERWGYFFALVYAMSIPWQLSLFKRKWLVWTLFLVSLWPIARWWDSMLNDPLYAELRYADLNDQRRLRQAADFIKEHAPGGILAPWWWSPQLVYWSGQPALAGSSHESLPGIVDTSRFFETTDPAVAKQICNSRYVETVVTGEPENIVIESAHILGQPLPEDEEKTMADILWIKPHSAPMFLHLIFDNDVIKVFEVNHGSVTYQ